ncbi:MAG: crossover junction endodeoxyribonuclease RuvC [Chitinophagales bacterium]|nr:crossover junction endodeoxyribonuclease RuvC [Chitinophagales bacterium]
MRILSFDVSSTTTAYCLLDTKNPLLVLDYGFIKPKKNINILEKLRLLELDITNIVNRCSPDEIAIEDIAMFMKGKSTANTIVTLALFNRVVGLTCHKMGKTPELYSVLKIRHGLKINKTFPAKEEMPQLLETRFNIKFPYLYNKKGKIKTESYDVADAFSVGFYHALRKNELK